MKKDLKKRIKTKYKWLTSRVKIVIKLAIILVLLGVLTGGILFYVKYGKDILDSQQMAKECVGASTEDTFKQNQTSIVYDCNGDVISTVKGDKDSYYIKYEDIPECAKDVMVITEDKTFYEHDGLDYKANLAAIVSLIENKGEIKRGGSTITQQLARNIFLNHEVTWKRKVNEIFIAQELEKKYDKYQILEFYLNNIYFANGYYGIQAAAKGYFDKAVTELGMNEIMFLCAIPNNPTMYDPLTNFDNTIERKNRMLKQMYEAGKISKEEYEQNQSQSIVLNMTKKVKNDYVETYVYYCATRALMSKNGFVFKNSFDTEEQRTAYEEEYNEMYNQCQQMLFSKGYRIYTSIDMDKQEKLQESVDNALAGFTELKENGIFAFQGAAACIDNNTGRVVAIVGGRKQDTIGYTLNRAFQSFRQPGSAIKPILLYAPAFENGYIPSSRVMDEEIEGGPKNAGGGYLGEISLRTAIEKSVNTVAWNMYETLSPIKCLGYIVSMDFSKITYDDTYPAMSLGGTTYGASAVEMASAYAALENDGIFITPTCIVKIMNAQGDEIIANPSSKKEVYEKNSARMMTNVLEGVMTKGTAKGYALPGVESAGKTGTTDNKKDGWFVGYSSYYTTAVWVGYDMPRAVEELKGNTYPLYIWYDYMTDIHQGLNYRGFEMYEEEEETVATKTPTKSPTKKPVATKSPTKEPTIEPTKVPTKVPTKIPDVEPEDTKKPETEKPVKTKKPLETEEPEGTGEPEKTKEPEETKAPISSAPPQWEEDAEVTDTREPVATQEPGDLKEPAGSQVPNTREPQISVTPTPTKDVTRTLAPSEWTPYPLQTRKPVVTPEASVEMEGESAG